MVLLILRTGSPRIESKDFLDVHFSISCGSIEDGPAQARTAAGRAGPARADAGAATYWKGLQESACKGSLESSLRDLRVSFSAVSSSCLSRTAEKS